MATFYLFIDHFPRGSGKKLFVGPTDRNCGPNALWESAAGRELHGSHVGHSRLLIYKGSSRINNVGSTRDVFEHKISDATYVGCRNLDDEIIRSRHHGDGQCFCHGEKITLEFTNARGRLRLKSNTDKGLDWPAQSTRIHLGVPTPNDAAGTQTVKTLVTSGLSNADFQGQIFI
jgi:hypothetical protein